jgi:hypothetical protein
VKSLAAFLAANDMPAEVDDVTTGSIRAFLVGERDRTTAAFSQQHYRNLSVFWSWLAAEGERAGEYPMTRVSKPEVPVRMKPFFAEDDLPRLLRATSGQDFDSRRDHAILRVLIDTGVRVSGDRGLPDPPRTGPSEPWLIAVVADVIALTGAWPGGGASTAQVMPVIREGRGWLEGQVRAGLLAASAGGQLEELALAVHDQRATSWARPRPTCVTRGSRTSISTAATRCGSPTPAASGSPARQWPPAMTR